MTKEWEQARRALFYATAAERVTEADAHPDKPRIPFEAVVGEEGYADFLKIDTSREKDAELFE